MVFHQVNGFLCLRVCVRACDEPCAGLFVLASLIFLKNSQLVDRCVASF